MVFLRFLAGVLLQKLLLQKGKRWPGRWLTSTVLLRPQGIIGDTYERFTVGQEAFNPNSTYFLPEDVRFHFPA